ncbi:MAG: sortase, partial [Lapillicoccus sp.]
RLTARRLLTGSDRRRGLTPRSDARTAGPSHRARPPVRATLGFGATSRRTRVASAAAAGVAVLALLAACFANGPDPAVSPSGPSAAVSVVPGPSADPTAPSVGPSTSATAPTAPSVAAAPSTSQDPAPSAAPAPAPAPAAPGLPTTIQPVAQGELVSFQVRRQSSVILDAASSGLARYNTSASCEVPGQPCYDAPTFDKVARIDLGATPKVPGTDTTFITGHSNRYVPGDPTKGIFSALQNVRTGDTLVLRTTKGTFVYAVSSTLSVPFDRLTTTDEVVRVRADTVVAISCVIAPDRASYLGNYVVIGTLRASAPR